MNYLRIVFAVIVVFIVGAAPAASASVRPAALDAAALTTSPSASASASATAALASGSASPVLTEDSTLKWTTIVYLNTAALCPAPSFELVTTIPNDEVTGNVSSTRPDCSPAASAAAGLTAVTLTFGRPADLDKLPPVTAVVVVVPAAPTAAPLSIPVTVRRYVTSGQYLWVPVWSGLLLALLLVGSVRCISVWEQAHAEGQPKTRRRRRFLGQPLYASAAWTFGGSWTTNITAAGTVAAALLTASGAVSELLPGVELSRFTLLIAVSGAITVAAPLVFGVLNYQFERVDPTTAGVSVIVPAPEGPERKATITVPAGATITVSGQAAICAAESPPAPSAPSAPSARNFTTTGANGLTRLPEVEATLKPGAVLSVPPGAIITVSQAAGSAAQEARAGEPEARGLVALPGGSDIAVFAGQIVTISPWATMAASDDTTTPATNAQSAHNFSYQLLPDRQVTMQGGAKITFLGRASLELPAGTCIFAPLAGSPSSPKSSPLKDMTAFPLPHTGQVIAAQMWTMLVASCLTLFGTGAALGTVGVLALRLSSAAFQVRLLCVAGVAVAAAVVWVYSVVAIQALADPRPGDALNATGSTSFML